MSLEELQAQQTQLVLQRSQAQDVVKQSEAALGQIGFAIQALQADAKAREEALADSGVVTD